jgi:nickel transport protein
MKSRSTATVTSRATLLRALAVAALLAPAAAAAHEVTHDVVYGRAVAVRARYAGAEPLAYAEYQVFSPSDANVPWAKGRTDREGWLAFVPFEAGTWRVQVADSTGHGVILSVSARPLAVAPERAEGTLSWLVRLAGAVLVVGIVFVALAAVQRQRRRRSAT